MKSISFRMQIMILDFRYSLLDVIQECKIRVTLRPFARIPESENSKIHNFHQYPSYTTETSFNNENNNTNKSSSKRLFRYYNI